MEEKLIDYKSRLKTAFVHFARFLDARINNDILSDIDILRDVLHVSLSIPYGVNHSDTERDLELKTPQCFPLKQLLDESSLRSAENGEVTKFQ